MNLYHSEESTLERVANILGLEIIDAEVNGFDCYAFAEFSKPEKIIYGPVVDGEPLSKEGIADHLLEILNEADPNDICPGQIFKVLDKDEYDDFAYIYAMAEIMTVCDDFVDDFCDKTEAEAAQQIRERLIEIVEDVQK